MNASGISRRLITLSSALLGSMRRRRWAQVSIVHLDVFFAEISGSAVADCRGPWARS